MKMYEVDNHKTDNQDKIKRIDEILFWFKFEYPERLLKIQRYKYLNLKCDETRYGLEVEAYNKENELRELRGLEKLPPLKITNLL